MRLRITILLALLFAFIQNATSQDKLTKKAIARFYFEEVLNKKRLDLLSKVYADTFVVHILGDTVRVNTIDDQRGFLKYVFKAFPDIRFTVGDVLEEEDKTVTRVTWSGTHTKEFWGHQPKGSKTKNVSEIFFFRFQNSKVVESWVQIDMYRLFRQLKGE